MKSFNNFYIFGILILLLILVGIYYVFYKNDIANQCICLFDNNIFKFTVFIAITYVSSYYYEIGIGLALVIFINYQIITHIKFKKEIDNIHMIPL